jgi:hypothetical protein
MAALSEKDFATAGRTRTATEVLARLLALNRERAHAEGQTLDASPEPPADSDGKKRGRVADKHRSLSLLPQGKKEA